MTELDEILREFLVESSENLDRLDQELVALEEDPTSSETINSIFRNVHTIKGTCGFFDFKKLEAVSHVGENLLDSLRDNRIPVSKSIITALLKLSDALRTMLSSIENTGTEGSEEYEDLRNVLRELNRENVEEPSSSKESSPIVFRDTIVVGSENVQEESVIEEPNKADLLEEVFKSAQKEYLTEVQPVTNVEVQQSTPRNQPNEYVEKQTKGANSTEEGKKVDVADSALRVDISLLDKLMNLVGELVLARNQILQFTKNQSNGDFVSTSQRLNLITSELQEGVMRTRMQPIANVWNKFPRIVRDIAHLCGKQVKLEMHGKETELDKTIIEAIKDPLTHIIRNAVDHGIEEPNARINARKSAEGTLTMKAFHEGGQVIIEISDDGAGLNVERIKNKAIDRGIVPPDKISRMSEQEILRLIFLPGFSTAEKVTNLSGRGVGMDVVRSNIERIGGAVDVSSQFQRGTTFTIKIPLTLAIIPALIVTAAGGRYAIPQVNLLELVRIEGMQIKKNLEEIHDAMFYRLRGKLLPLVRLRDELKIDLERSINIKDENVLSIVVVRADNHEFGLLVDGIYDTEEIVVKPLGKLMKQVAAFAGATIMGDGRVALILDVTGLARQAEITKNSQEDIVSNQKIEQNKEKLLIFRITENHRAAIPLEEVHRLEEFDSLKLERAGGCTVVQYRDGILPLIDLQEILDGKRPEYRGIVRAFVCKYQNQYVGFVVEQILDIVEEVIKVETPYQRTGIIGSAIIQGVVTDLVDLAAVLESSALKSGRDRTHSLEGGVWNQ